MIGLNRYDVTVIVDCNGGDLPNPADFAVTAEQAASSRNASVVSAHTSGQIINVVTVWTADQSLAVTVALAVVSEALGRPVVSSSAYEEADQQGHATCPPHLLPGSACRRWAVRPVADGP